MGDTAISLMRNSIQGTKKGKTINRNTYGDPAVK